MTEYDPRASSFNAEPPFASKEESMTTIAANALAATGVLRARLRGVKPFTGQVGAETIVASLQKSLGKRSAICRLHGGSWPLEDYASPEMLGRLWDQAITDLDLTKGGLRIGVEASAQTLLEVYPLL